MNNKPHQIYGLMQDLPRGGGQLFGGLAELHAAKLGGFGGMLPRENFKT